MPLADAKSLSALGFLAVIEHQQHGLFGGYLVLNAAGRPLEFHCTAPVKPSRAQQILYGPTLQPYLYGEQIGQTLVARSKLQAPIVLTDTFGVLALRDLVTTPVGLVLPDDDPDSIEAQPDAGPPLATFRVGRHRLAVSVEHDADRARLTRSLESLVDRFDLAEPFQRIRDAIAEAHRAAA